MSKTFVDGLICKEAKPEFIRLKLSFKVEEITKWLQQHEKSGWVNVDVCESKNGKLYASLDDWEPNQATDSRGDDKDDIPF